MGLFDKVKNLFTEEVEEEVKPVKKETRYVEPQPPKKEEVVASVIREKEEEKQPPVPTKEEKFVFFSDDDFKDLEKPKLEPKKVEKKEEKPVAYKGAVPQIKPETKKEFKPSPIISPVYGVLDKNYKKDEVISKKVSSRIYKSSTVTVDDVRNKAYGTLEDDIKDDLFGKAYIEETKEEPVENDINIFEELEKYEENEPEKISRSTSDVDEIFGKLDNKKDEILDELDNKKDEILDEIDTKKSSLNLLSEDYESKDEKKIDDSDIAERLSDVENIENEEDTDSLAQKLEDQKKKLEEINNLMDENEKVTKNNTDEVKENDNLDESELFNLIDSMYEKKDDE